MLQRPALLALPFLLAIAPAQTAAFVPFGTGCTFDNQTLAIGNVGLPQIGASFRITYSGPNHTHDFRQQIAWPQLALGLQAQNFPIPQNLLPQQPAGCTGELVPDAMLATLASSSGTTFDAFFDLAMPNDPGLLGVQFLAQWLTIHQQCGIVGCGIDAALTSDAAIVLVGL